MKNPKNPNFEKMRKKSWSIWYCWISSFYTCAPNTTIIWGTVPEIRSETNFICRFGPFLPSPPLLTTQKTKFWKNEKRIRRCHHLKLVQQKTRSNNVCLLRLGAQDITFCHFRPFFALLSHYWPQELKFEKKYKKLEILSFYTCAP